MLRRSLLIAAFVILLASSSFSQTTIEWWQFWTDPGIKPTIEAMVDEFEQQNPDIKVKLTDMTWANGHEKIVLAFASKTAPDIVELGSDWIAQFADNGHLADLSEHVAADSSQYQGWGMANYKGRIYGKPWILGTRVLFINTDIIAEAGFPTDFAPTKARHLIKAAQVLHDLGDDIYGWGSNAPEKHRLYKKFLPFFWSAGAQVFTEDNEFCVVSSTYAINGLDAYKHLHDSVGYVANQRGIEDAFLDGKIAFILSGEWLLKRIKNENRKIGFSTSYFPGANGPGKSFMGGEFLCVSEASPNKDAALKFVDFITSPENQLRFCKANMSANPSSRIAQEDAYFQSDPNLMTFIRQMKTAVHPPVDPDWVYFEDIIEKAVEDAIFNGKPRAEALLEAQRKITEIRKKR